MTWRLHAGKILSVALLLAAVLVLLIVGCDKHDLAVGQGTPVSGTGNMVSRTYDISGFLAIRASDGLALTITQRPSFEITVTAEENILPLVQVYRDGTTLVLGLKDGIAYSVQRPHVSVSIPEMNTLVVADGVQAEITTLCVGGQTTFTVTSGSRLSARMVMADVVLFAEDGSEAVLYGKAKSLALTASGHSRAAVHEYEVGWANADVTGASSASLYVTRTLGLTVTEGSQASYRGSPEVTSAFHDSSSSIESR